MKKISFFFFFLWRWRLVQAINQCKRASENALIFIQKTREERLLVDIKRTNKQTKEKGYKLLFSEFYSMDGQKCTSTAMKRTHSGSFKRLKRTRKLCSGTTYRKPRSAPLTYGLIPYKIKNINWKKGHHINLLRFLNKNNSFSLPCHWAVKAPLQPTLDFGTQIPLSFLDLCNQQP